MNVQPSELTRERQRRAAEPSASAWVAANAGSGKTTVLANRVIRLLLADVEPPRILCLTFTKAAAANMSNRVFGVLAKWATAPDAELDEALRNLGEPAATPAVRARARRLFARALETPGGLKVLTIHAFCERVLHQFPFEAAVPAAFTVLEERQQRELVAEARAEVLTLAATGGPLGAALSRLVQATSDGAMSKALDALLIRGEALAELLRPDGADASAKVSRRLATALGLAEGETSVTIRAHIMDEAIPASHWPGLMGWLGNGGTNGGKVADCFRAAHAATDDDARRAAYLGLCLRKDGGLRSRNTLATKALRAARPDLAKMLDDEFDRLAGLLDRLNAAETRERTEALLTVADAIWSRYGLEKARRGALDFADLIRATSALLRNAGSAWVHYKLDQGIDHVLVDEAQDTSPEQWAIVQGLTREFNSGEGARNAVRTIFAVGDEKQSIFGFQGAAPAKFAEMRRTYASAHLAARRSFDFIQLTQSFRSTAHVLGAVDLVFAQPEAYRGLSADEVRTQHETARPDAPGRVEIWPLVLADPKADSDRAWDAPFDEISEKSPVAVLSSRIAHAVKGWIAGRDLSGPCTPVPPGQILVLVRKRDALFEAILRHLKQADVPVAGADRLDIGEHIAVLDLLALADAVLLEDDDLALASVLKSPLLGLDDDDLMRLTDGRNGSLRAALRESHEPRFADASRRLADLGHAARRQRPFDFYADILGEGGGRRAFRARLGHEVDDVLDEFLRLAMTYGETETATLSGFAGWMRAAPAEIKRDLDVGGGEVRVMTVHGAKGLEAGLVVMADLGPTRAPQLAPVIYTLRELGVVEGEPDLLVWSAKKAEDPPALMAARGEEELRELGEHKRLLYVAMTRAADRLVVAGHIGDYRKREAPDGSWYRLIRSGLEPHAEKLPVEDFGGDILVFGATDATAEPAEPGQRAEAHALPDWLRSGLAPEKTGATHLAPSRALPHNFPPASASMRAIPAVERGSLLHRLLEELPALAEADRAPAAASYLERAAADWPDEHAAIADEALALIADPTLEPLLTGPGRSEVPIVGEIARPGRSPVQVSGRIDRLIVTPDRVLILDFKSDRPVPAAAPEAYVGQLALYRAVLRRIFPDHAVDTAVLWTMTRRLDYLPGAQLDAALQRMLGIAGFP